MNFEAQDSVSAFDVKKFKSLGWVGQRKVLPMGSRRVVAAGLRDAAGNPVRAGGTVACRGFGGVLHLGGPDDAPKVYR